MPTTQSGALRGLYNTMFEDRDPFLWLGREAAALTIPYLLPRNTADGYQRENQGPFPEPHQMIGAQGVNNLTNKLMIGLLPINQTFVRMKLEPAAEAQVLRLPDGEVLLEQIDAELAQIESAIMDAMDVYRVRPKVHQGLMNAVVTGNSLLYFQPKKPVRVFRLDSYCVDRDPRGHVIRIVTHEQLDYTELPEAVQKKLPDKEQFGAGVPDYEVEPNPCDLLTGVERQITGSKRGGKFEWVEWQEIDGIPVGVETVHKADRLPYMPLRFHPVDGESYGRGHVEQYMGALRTLEGLVAGMQDCVYAAARLLVLVNEDAGRTRISKIRTAPNGAMIPGHTDDITFLQANKFADVRMISEEINRLERQLNHAFLITVPRDAERVTAEEIRLISQQLHDTLGGAYSMLAEDLQIPLVNILIGRLREEGSLPDLKQVRPVIVTGLEAISRGHEFDRLQRFFLTGQQTVGPEVTAAHVNMGVFFEALRKALGIDVPNLVKSPQQLAEEQRAAEMRATMETVGPALVEKFPNETAMALQQRAGA